MRLDIVDRSHDMLELNHSLSSKLAYVVINWHVNNIINTTRQHNNSYIKRIVVLCDR